MTESLIFDIKRFAIHDGPGIRLVVFFKGCNLHCTWCHNPESIGIRPEKLYSPVKCLLCGMCIEACPKEIISMSPEGIQWDKEKCDCCGLCVEACPSKAMELSGQTYNLNQIIEIIEKEKAFFDQSGGGVTFSGGEPLLHKEFLLKILKECGKRGIHRAVDTAGNVDENTILEVAAQTDLFLYDLKLMDEELHKKWTGVSNKRILKNLESLISFGSKVVVRVPLIPGVNDTEDNLYQTARFLHSLPGNNPDVNILPYHNIAQNKYLKMDKLSEFHRFTEPSNEMLNLAVSIFQEIGLKVEIGG